MTTTGGRVWITGASGTLGRALTTQAAAAGWATAALYFSHPERVCAGNPVRLDLRDWDALCVLADSFPPDVIIHTAVTERSGPGYAETIRLAGDHMARLAAERGSRLIALSTDLVFDGSEPLYTEETPPRPMPGSAYGLAKAEAEQIILNRLPAALVVRTSLIYDFVPDNPQVAWMLRALARGEPVRLFTDQLRCPIWAVNLAEALLELAGCAGVGVLHIVGPQTMSRYDLGVALLEAFGIDPAGRVVPVLAPPTMPPRLVLSIERARALLSTPLLTIAAARIRWERAGTDSSYD